jgi:FdhE protein
MNLAKWDRRIERADKLATSLPFSAELLNFYTRLTGIQKQLYASIAGTVIEDSSNRAPRLRPQDLRLDLLLPLFARFLGGLEMITPEPLARSANELKCQQWKWADVLFSCWDNPTDFELTPDKVADLLGLLFLRPYAEYLADQRKRMSGLGTSAFCPFCSGKPHLGVLRPEGDGAKRFLICSVCSTEWACGRILCPVCGEEAVDKLAIYTASQFSHVRVEACDTCGYYIKTVDLTKNGLAVPVVDDLATIALNLWAHEQGYLNIQKNVLGI